MLGDASQSGRLESAFQGFGFGVLLSGFLSGIAENLAAAEIRHRFVEADADVVEERIGK